MTGMNDDAYVRAEVNTPDVLEINSSRILRRSSPQPPPHACCRRLSSDPFVGKGRRARCRGDRPVC